MINTFQSILIWFYCLPIPVSILMLILATLIFTYLKTYLEKFSWWKYAISAILLAWLFVVVYATVVSRDTGNMTPHNLIPFHSYMAVMNGENPEILRSNLMNIILFYPAGLMTSVLLSRKWKHWLRVLFVLFLFAAISTIIEYAQYIYALGSVEIDDVIHNAFGALLGGIFGIVNLKINK